MLSFVLPLLAIAIVLTPFTASVGAIYKREVDQYSRSLSDVEISSNSGFELHH